MSADDQRESSRDDGGSFPWFAPEQGVIYAITDYDLAMDYLYGPIDPLPFDEDQVDEHDDSVQE